MNSIPNIKSLFISFLFIISIGNAFSLLDFNYPSAISLTNGNVFIVEQNGIYVYDEGLKNIIYSYPFQENEKITDVATLSKVIIKYEMNNIICLIKEKIYFFDYEGKLLKKTGTLISDNPYYHPSLTHIPLSDLSSYFYVISYFINVNNSYNQRVLYYKISLSSKANSQLDDLTLDKFESKAWAGLATDTYEFKGMGLSCEYMQCENDDSYNFLVCVLTIKKDDASSLSLNYFKVNLTAIEKSKTFKAGYVDGISNIQQIKSVVKNDRRSSLVCILFASGKLYCTKFHFIDGFTRDTVEFYDDTSIILNCRIATYTVKLNYLSDGKKISLSCLYLQRNTTVQAKFFNQDLNLLSYSYAQFQKCSKIFGHSIILYKSHYYVISDVICDSYKRCFEPLNGELKPIVIIPTTEKIEIPTEKAKEEEKEEEEEKEKEKEK